MVDIGKDMSEETTPLLDRVNESNSVPEVLVSKETKADSNVSGQNGHAKFESSASTFSQFSRRQKFVLVLCTSAMFWAGCAFSILGPFYPVEAEKKGMSTVLTGVVFGSFEVVIFISSPFYGTYLSKLGPKFVFIAGIFVGGMCNILFGTLDKCPDGTPFIVTSIVCRCIEALGFSGFITASFAIVSSEFEDNIGMSFGIIEAGSGLGFIAGPVIGGMLYELGGYGFPFYFIGAMVLLNAAMLLRFLPSPHSKPTKRRVSIFYLLRSPLVVVAMGCVFSGVVGLSTYDATFARRLEPFGMSTLTNSLFFSIVAVVYTPLSMVYGFITDKKDIQAPLIVGGIIIFGFAYLIMGPSVLLPFVPSKVWTVIVAQILFGATYGCALIPTMKCMVNGAIGELHFENSLDTYALVSGLFNCVHCLGGFVGPVGVGALVEEFGYPIAYTAVGLLNLFMGVMSLLFFSIRHARNRYGAASTQDCSDTLLEDRITILFQRSLSLSNSHG